MSWNRQHNQDCAGRTSGARRRGGFSLTEVMIAIMLLSTAIAALLGHAYTLNQTRALNLENQKAMEIARSLAERLQGAAWHSLGRLDQPWSWHRHRTVAPDGLFLWYDAATASWKKERLTCNPVPDRGDFTRKRLVNDSRGFSDVAYKTAVPAAPPPLTDLAGVDANHSLVGLGMLDAASGLQDLCVFLEYYTMAAAAAGADPKSWQDACDLGLYTLVYDPNLFDLRQVTDAVVMRILVCWNSIDGSVRTHELVTCRRK